MVNLTHPSEKKMDESNQQELLMSAPPGLIALFKQAQTKYPDKLICLEPEPNQDPATGIYLLKISPKKLPTKEEYKPKAIDWITICKDTVPGIKEFLNR